MIKSLIKLSFLTALVVGIVLMMEHIGPLGADTRVMLKYLGLGALGLMALSIVAVTILGLTAIIMGLSFAKSAAGLSARAEKGAGFLGGIVGGAVKGALGGLGSAGKMSSRTVELSVEKYDASSFKIKTLTGDLTLAGHDQPGAKASVEILEKNEGDAEVYFEDGELKVRTSSGARASIGDATVFLPARLSGLSAESVNGDIVISGFVTGGQASFKGVNGDISVASLKNSGEALVKTVSGDVEIKESQFNTLTAQSISGDVEIKDSAADSAVLKTVSGDIDYAGSDIKNPSVKTVSGSVTR
jgi:DUF4097 and DUF4098 domain-containing protein YvlB